MTAFSNVDRLKSAILETSSDDFFDAYISGRQTPHFDEGRLDFVAEVMHAEYGVTVERHELVVVGSSKLGFALHDKVREGTVISPAFRKFGPDSDIDLSICSPILFDILWHELSAYMCRQRYMPYRHKKLGDYLAYGWLRQDHIPNAPAPHLTKCDNLRFANGRVKKDRRRGHPKVNFGVFHDIAHLKLYQSRSIDMCRNFLENPL